jgi:ribosome biogenesis GTPase A
MSLQWYPGHMTKARRVLAESMPSKDVVIEVLDARMPAASANPLITELRGQKPCVKVLAKSDLADPDVTAAWLRHFEGQAGGKVLAIALSSKRPEEARTRLPALCKRLAPPSNRPGRGVRVLVVGIPNVGKSTLINTLMERVVAKVGDEPAVTKAQQLVVLKSGMTLSDNPGIMWPKIDDAEGALRLALGGAIPDSAIDYESVGLFGAGLLLSLYPERLMARYGLEAVPESAAALLLAIGKKRGCIRSGGAVDVHKAADILVHELRAGKLGRISLESPPGARAPGASEEAQSPRAVNQASAMAVSASSEMSVPSGTPFPVPKE